jgi:hypothetical protein
MHLAAIRLGVLTQIESRMNHSNTDSMMLEEGQAGPKDFAQIRLD